MAGGNPDEFLYLTTTGRKSGQLREIEIWFTEHQGRYYIIAEHGSRANWVRNIMAKGDVQVRVAGQAFAATARVLPDRDYDGEMAKQRSRDKYGWGDGLVVEIASEIAPKTTPK
jgi:deazaflavin-dependent oxidoreductase (nitroreductase family)